MLLGAGTALAVALFLAVVANRLTEALVVPLFEKFNIDRFWLLYVAWAISAGVVALTGVNLFEQYLPSALAGRVLTAIVAGGGSNFIADLFNEPSTSRLSMKARAEKDEGKG